MLLSHYYFSNYPTVFFENLLTFLCIDEKNILYSLIGQVTKAILQSNKDDLWLVYSTNWNKSSLDTTLVAFKGSNGDRKTSLLHAIPS